MTIRDVREHFPGLNGKTFLDSACVGLPLSMPSGPSSAS